MSFTSALKRSLGFEETEEESKNRKNNENSFSIGSIIDALKDLLRIIHQIINNSQDLSNNILQGQL